MAASYFVTGSTGLIGKELTPRLLERGGRVFVLVRPSSVPFHGALFAEWQKLATVAGGELVIVEGDVSEKGLGLQGELGVSFDHVFHACGHYDIAGDPDRMRAVNVDGTRHLVEWLASHHFKGTFHHVSSVAVAGDFEGTFPEDELHLQQEHPHPYHRSKFDSEAMVREVTAFKWRIYRPSAVVGHSKTGAMERPDGPYYLFKGIQKVRYALPGWFPLLGWSREPVNMVPVDWVGAALDVIAHRDGFDGKTFHLTDPNPPSLVEFFNMVADEAGAPRIKRTLPTKSKLLPGAGDMIRGLGATKFIKAQLLSEFQIPAEIGDAKNAGVRFGRDNTHAALDGANLECPRVADYVGPMWHYWELHLDPDRDGQRRWRRAFEGKTVLITGASSGIGESLARKCAQQGARVLCVARREELLQALVGQIREDGGDADYYVADLADLGQTELLIERVLADHGGIDVLVNNAAKSIRRSIEESYDRFHDYQRTMELNYYSPVRLCLGFLPSMQKCGGGHIVQVLTAGANMPSPRFGAYTASKAALGAFTDTLSAEYLHENIHTTSAYLSWVVTPMMTATEKYREKAEKEDVMTPDRAAEWIMDGVALKKRRLQSAEVARRFVWSVLFPTFMTRALSLVYQLYHDDRERFPQFEVDRAVFKRFFKTDLL